MTISENEVISKWQRVTGQPPKRNGREWRGLCPIHELGGDHKPSLDMRFDNGRPLWTCRSAGCSSAAINAAICGTAAKPHPSHHATGGRTFSDAVSAVKACTPKGYTHTATYIYRDISGADYAAVARYDATAGKTIRPFARTPQGWVCGDPATWYPYRINEVQQHDTVYINEGEKCCDAAWRIGLPSITSAHGSQAAAKTNWDMVRGKNVIVFPDNDEPGEKYAATVAGILCGLGNTVRIVHLPGLSEGGDIVDYLVARPENEDIEQTIANIDALAQAATPWTPPAGGTPTTAVPKSAADVRREIKAAEMAALVDGITLWHDAENEPYASISTGGHCENWPVVSKAFSRFIRGKFYTANKVAMSDDDWTNIRVALEAEAVHAGEQHETAIRICRAGAVVYLDLADADWCCVRVTADGWDVVPVADSPVMFLRRRGMLPLPEPVHGGSIDALRPLLNLPDDNAWILAVAWLLGALNPAMPQVVLAITGEQGSAKSTACRILRGVIDKNKCSSRRPPKTEDDLFIAANTGLVISMDNLSALPGWLSDALCSLSTGGGLSKRQLYTDSDETILDARRPIMLNGIEDIATRPDLLDRSICIHLPAIPAAKRRAEDSVMADFGQIHPAVLGALLDAVACGLRKLPTVRLDTLPRMADFARWVTACEAALPWPAGSFIRAYSENIQSGNVAALEGSAVATAIQAFMAERETWEGTFKELLAALDTATDEKTQRQKTWPASPRGLSGAIERCKPNLRRAGITITDTGRNTHGAHTVQITVSPQHGKDIQNVHNVQTPSKFNGLVSEHVPEHVPVEPAPNVQTSKPEAEPRTCPPDVTGNVQANVQTKNPQISSLFGVPEHYEHSEHVIPACGEPVQPDAVGKVTL